MARRKWKWPQAVSIEVVDRGTEEKYNFVQHATSALVGGLILGSYGLARADHKHGPKTVLAVTFELTYPDGSTELVTCNPDRPYYRCLTRLMAELEAKNNTN